MTNIRYAANTSPREPDILPPLLPSFFILTPSSLQHSKTLFNKSNELFKIPNSFSYYRVGSRDARQRKIHTGRKPTLDGGSQLTPAGGNFKILELSQKFFLICPKVCNTRFCNYLWFQFVMYEGLGISQTVWTSFFTSARIRGKVEIDVFRK